MSVTPEGAPIRPAYAKDAAGNYYRIGGGGGGGGGASDLDGLSDVDLSTGTVDGGALVWNEGYGAWKPSSPVAIYENFRRNSESWYLLGTTTFGDPGANCAALDSTTLTSVTNLVLSAVTGSSNVYSIDDQTMSKIGPGWLISVQGPPTSVGSFILRVTAAAGNYSTYWSIPVTLHSQADLISLYATTMLFTLVPPGIAGGGGISQTAADTRYVNVAGDLMQGTLNFAQGAFINMQGTGMNSISFPHATIQSDGGRGDLYIGTQMGGTVGDIEISAEGRVSFTTYDSPGQFTFSGGTVDVDLNRIISVGPPVDPDDAATKAYVDSKAGGLTVAGAGLTKTGTTVDVIAGDTTLTVAADSVVVNQAVVEVVSRKGAASGYASLDSGTKIPIAQVPTGTSSTTVALGNHAHAGVYDPAGTAASAVTAHEAAADPHTGYQKESEKAAASGYASLDGTTKVPLAQLPTGTTAATVALGDAAAALLATHAGAADPHTGYVLATGTRAMTGDLNVNSSVIKLDSPGTASIIIDRQATTNYGQFEFRTNGVQKWTVGTRAGEGEDFSIFGTVNRALMVTATTSLITVYGDPTAALGVATKQYVDARTPKVVAQSTAPADTSVIWLDIS